MTHYREPVQVAFVGRSGIGKTRLIERLVPVLRARGLKVGVVKHTHHFVEMDREGKDSWRFANAGAERVLLQTPEKAFLQLQTGPAETDSSLFAGLDLVIHEGGSASGHMTVLVGAGPRVTYGPVIATVGSGVSAPLPSFDRDDVASIATFLAALARPKGECNFESLLERSVAEHGHLCPGQVLGVRMTMAALSELGLEIPPPRKRLLAVVETDRCAVDAIASVSGCSLGKRSLKLIDYGKMAATFIDLLTGEAVRVAVRDDSREGVTDYAPSGPEGHDAQTEAYRVMPSALLLKLARVHYSLGEADLPGVKRDRAACARCEEHVTDGHEVVRDGVRLCRPCAGDSYYSLYSLVVPEEAALR